MRSKYFCAYHSEKMKTYETEAYRYWMEVMRRGVQSYAKCRSESAHIYLHTALDIGLLRQRCKRNGVFEELHITKPAEFLIQLFIADDNVNGAFDLLSYISSRTQSTVVKINDPLLHFLNESHKIIVTAEKSCPQNTDRDHTHTNLQKIMH
mgnify:CR=1 FL=1